jgi:hypothetical protein
MKWLKVTRDMFVRRLKLGWIVKVINPDDLSPGRNFAITFIRDPQNTITIEDLRDRQ